MDRSVQNFRVASVGQNNHINGIEAFRSFTKHRLVKFNGVKANFPLHLKDCEWRYNKSASFLAKNLLPLIKNPVEVLV